MLISVAYLDSKPIIKSICGQWYHVNDKLVTAQAMRFHSVLY